MRIKNSSAGYSLMLQLPSVSANVVMYNVAWCVKENWENCNTHWGQKFGASVNYWDQLGKCDRIYHNYDKYVQGSLKPIWHIHIIKAIDIFQLEIFEYKSTSIKVDPIVWSNVCSLQSDNLYDFVKTIDVYFSTIDRVG